MTSTETVVAVEQRPLRPSHRRVMQLFRTFGAMTHQEALDAARTDGWDISPSGLRSRVAELCPPRGAGLLNTHRKRKIGPGAGQTIWDLDPAVDEPYITVGGKD